MCFTFSLSFCYLIYLLDGRLVKGTKRFLVHLPRGNSRLVVPLLYGIVSDKNNKMFICFMYDLCGEILQIL